jgi:excisionase family DNA binding protein
MNNTENRADERLLRVREIAAQLGIHPQSVRRLVWSGTLPSVRVGHSVRVPANAVRAFLDKCPTAAKEQR